MGALNGVGSDGGARAAAGKRAEEEMGTRESERERESFTQQGSTITIFYHEILTDQDSV